MQATQKLAPAAIAFVLVVLAGCEQVDVFVSAVQDEGTVYKCSTRDGAVVELCYLDDAEGELGDLLGGSCGDPSRNWPWLANKLSVGCAYSCPPKHLGCNAYHGCYCP